MLLFVLPFSLSDSLAGWNAVACMASDPSPSSLATGPAALMAAVNCPNLALMEFFWCRCRYYLADLPGKKTLGLSPVSFSVNGSTNNWATRRGNMAK